MVLYIERCRYCIGLTIALRWMGANTWRNPEGMMETGLYIGNGEEKCSIYVTPAYMCCEETMALPEKQQERCRFVKTT